jgi:hypothetical protein
MRVAKMTYIIIQDPMQRVDKNIPHKKIIIIIITPQKNKTTTASGLRTTGKPVGVSAICLV